MGGMPTPEARAAFNIAQKLAAELRDVHAHEHATMEMLDKPLDPQNKASLEVELKNLRVQWDRLFREYNAAIAKFTQEVEQARTGR